MSEKITQSDLGLHEKWLNNDPDGVRLSAVGANLSEANLSEANLYGANLSGADLIRADLSGAVGLFDCAQWMKKNFQHDDKGWIVYKMFGVYYTVNKNWNVNPGEYIEENVNTIATNDCGCGINFATLEWIKKNFGTRELPVWRCRIEWADSCSIVVPYNTDGKARCGRMQLLEVVDFIQ